MPVLFGLAAGERPSALAWLGVALAALAIPPLSKTGAGPGHYPRAHVRRTLMVAIAPAATVLIARLTLGERARPAPRKPPIPRYAPIAPGATLPRV